MATHHSTAPARAGERSRSPSTQVGPVTVALRTMRQAEPEAPALVALRQGLESYFADAGMPVDLSAQMDVERHRIHELRDAIAGCIEADIALLDALDGDPDLEDGCDAEPSLCGTFVSPPSPEDREDADDNGIGDADGLQEQLIRYKRLCRALRGEEARHG
ncbi:MULTISPECIES: hypothetical protein [Methylobacterium]|uniref:hypothetical protein n=1 Tax=Methylobacterium TaxID=407 RepID=UPI0013E99FBC|nr:hypothetical protein [Methylobacterium sp. DB0501]NGM33347.1 hypothetical protein [Methylobacterium sp. DB0501]